MGTRGRVTGSSVFGATFMSSSYVVSAFRRTRETVKSGGSRTLRTTSIGKPLVKRRAVTNELS
jgi:hypothetical protein